MNRTLRQDLMDAVDHFRTNNTENAEAQVKDSQESLVMALRYKIQADAADRFAMLIHSVLQKHGI